MEYSESTRALVDWIRAVVAGPVADAGELVGLFAALADAGEVRAVREVFPFVFAEDLVVARGAAEAVERLLRRAGADDFVWLDRHVRVYAPVRSRYDTWREIGRNRAARAARRTRHFAAAAGILSLHWDGYLREAVVRQLGEEDDPLAVPFVLLRLNDWVAEVRAAAARVVRGWLGWSWLGPLAENLPLVTRLKGAVRSQHGALVEAIERRLLTEEPPAALVGACRSPDRSVRRAAFALGLELEGRAVEGLLEEGLASEDGVLRLWTLRKLVRRGELAGDEERLERVLADRFMPVRREALLALSEEEPEAAGTPLERAVFDGHPAVRYLARWALSRMEERDFRGLYRRALEEAASPDEAMVALGGLGEVGTAEDVPAVRPFLEHRTVRVRAAAVWAVAKVGTDRDLGLVRGKLVDESPKVSLEAARAFEGRVYLIGGRDLWDLYVGSSAAHVRENVLHLMFELPVGERLVYLLRAAALEGGALAEEAFGRAVGTLQRPDLGYVQLSPSEKAAVREELERLGPRVGEWVRRTAALVLGLGTGDMG